MFWANPTFGHIFCSVVDDETKQRTKLSQIHPDICCQYLLKIKSLWKNSPADHNRPQIVRPGRNTIYQSGNWKISKFSNLNCFLIIAEKTIKDVDDLYLFSLKSQQFKIYCGSRQSNLDRVFIVNLSSAFTRNKGIPQTSQYMLYSVDEKQDLQSANSLSTSFKRLNINPATRSTLLALTKLWLIETVSSYKFRIQKFITDLESHHVFRWRKMNQCSNYATCKYSLTQHCKGSEHLLLLKKGK